MGRTGHHLTGLAAGCLAACALWGSCAQWSLLAITGGYIGGTAPDWMEIAHAEYSAKYRRWMRKSVIPHRTITHWWPVWALFLAGGLELKRFPGQMAFFAGILLIGFAAGGWMHLLMDIPNPTGIPIKTPYAKSRFGFGWWKSGNALEPMAGMVMVGASAFLLWILTNHLQGIAY